MVWDAVEDFELFLHGIRHLQNGGNVCTSVAVVGGRPDSNQVFVWEVVLISFLDELMRSGDQANAVDLTEF